MESTTSAGLADILPDMTPNELLLTLPEKTRIEIFTRRKTQEDPSWTPPKISIDVEKRKNSSKVGNKLLHTPTMKKSSTLNGFRASRSKTRLSSRNSQDTVYPHRYYVEHVENALQMSVR